MKKIFLILFTLFSINLFAAETGRSDMYTNRGLELMREANFYQLSNLSKESGSLQTVEAFLENSKKVNSKGILLGTVSNFVDAPSIHAGLTVAYQRYKFKDTDEKDREYALDTYLSYRKDKYLLIGGLGYGQAKHVFKRTFSTNIELGKFTDDKTFNIFDSGRFYYYTGLDVNNWLHKKRGDVNFINYRLGISSYHYINKFRFAGNLEINKDSKKYDKNREKYNASFTLGLGYSIYEDLLVELKYKGTKNEKFYNNLIALSFTHTF